MTRPARHARSLLPPLAGVVALACVLASARAQADDRPAPAPVIEQHFSSGLDSTSQSPLLNVRLTLDRASLTAAQRVHLALEADAPVDRTIAMPELADKLGDWTIASRQTRESYVGSPPRRRVQLGLTLEPFLTGEKLLPSLIVELKTPGGKSVAQVKTEPVKLLVTSVMPKGEPPELSKPRGLVELSDPPPIENSGRLVWALGGAAAVGLVGAMGVWAARRRQPPRPPPARVALDELSAVRRAMSDAARPLLPRDAAARTAACLRGYLASCLDAGASQRTTPELIALVSAHPALSGEQRSLSASLLVDLDRTRFAPGADSGDRVLALLDRTEQIVISIRNNPAPQSAGGSA